jgi:hypothetical protein
VSAVWSVVWCAVWSTVWSAVWVKHEVYTRVVYNRVRYDGVRYNVHTCPREASYSRRTSTLSSALVLLLPLLLPLSPTLCMVPIPTSLQRMHLQRVPLSCMVRCSRWRRLVSLIPPRMYCDGMSRMTRLSRIHGCTFAFTRISSSTRSSSGYGVKVPEEKDEHSV